MATTETMKRLGFKARRDGSYVARVPGTSDSWRVAKVPGYHVIRPWTLSYVFRRKDGSPAACHHGYFARAYDAACVATGRR